jgi:hypothetical protein
LGSSPFKFILLAGSPPTHDPTLPKTASCLLVTVLYRHYTSPPLSQWEPGGWSEVPNYAIFTRASATSRRFDRATASGVALSRRGRAAEPPGAAAVTTARPTRRVLSRAPPPPRPSALPASIRRKVNGARHSPPAAWSAALTRGFWSPRSRARPLRHQL